MSRKNDATHEAIAGSGSDIYVSDGAAEVTFPTEIYAFQVCADTLVTSIKDAGGVAMTLNYITNAITLLAEWKGLEWLPENAKKMTFAGTIRIFKI
jgi:hypothetical protein